MWGQRGDVVQLQFVDCGLVEGLVDLFGVKTALGLFSKAFYEPMCDNCF
jgi:hypothetical protein